MCSVFIHLRAKHWEAVGFPTWLHTRNNRYTADNFPSLITCQEWGWISLFLVFMDPAQPRYTTDAWPLTPSLVSRTENSVDCSPVIPSHIANFIRRGAIGDSLGSQFGVSNVDIDRRTPLPSRSYFQYALFEANVWTVGICPIKFSQAQSLSTRNISNSKCSVRIMQEQSKLWDSMALRYHCPSIRR